MANNKRSGSYVDGNGKVILSAQREKTISRLKDKKAAAQLRADFEQEIMEKHEARQAYLAERDIFGYEVTELGFMRVKGGGAKWAHFSKEGLNKFLEAAKSKEFKKAYEDMPEVPTKRVAE